jgi:hypothetical protein
MFQMVYTDSVNLLGINQLYLRLVKMLSWPQKQEVYLLEFFSGFLLDAYKGNHLFLLGFQE